MWRPQQVALLAMVTVTMAADGDMCYTPSGVLGIVAATFVVTVVVGAVASALLWWLWRRRHGWTGRHLSYATDKVSSHPAAFDNLYFREEEDEKGNKFTFTGSIANTKNGAKKIKTHPFSSVFHPNKKHKVQDDSCIAMEPERTTVCLKGHDFTGLGFNICGNMRDGIFVKDVLHRGPASESGNIKAGDKILGVTVSFTNIVYEDALTILSYASPYDVRLELQRTPTQPASPDSGNQTPGDSRLFHPLYRSQSIDDLTQIDRPQPSGLSLPETGLEPTGSLNERMLACAMGEDLRSRRAKNRLATGSLRAHRSDNFSVADIQDSIDVKPDGGFFRRLSKSARSSSTRKSAIVDSKESTDKPKLQDDVSISPDSLDKPDNIAPRHVESEDSLEHPTKEEQLSKKGSTKKLRESKSRESIPPITDMSQQKDNHSSVWKAKGESPIRNGEPGKEVIEISEDELDGVMMSHRQFLAMKAAANTRRSDNTGKYFP